MPLIKRFLIVDDNADGRSLLTRTLLRKFPQSLATECGDADTATVTVQTESVDAIVVHRAGETPGLELVTNLRAVAPKVPIVYVSGVERTEEALAAGATAFLNYDAWLRLGSLISELLELQSPPQVQPRRVAAQPSRR